jgi:6-phosphogluconolactonase
VNLRVFETAGALASELAGRIRRELAACGDAGAVMLAGGRTPLDAYRLLAADPISDGCRARVFLSDERMVPADSPDSNAGHIGPLLQAAGIAGDRFLRVDTTGTLETAAGGFDRALAALLAAGIRVPFGILGVGADGHTASLFSRADVEAACEGDRLAVPVRKPQPPDRISTTPRLLRRVEDLVFVVTGADKATIVRALLGEPGTIPAGLAVEGHPRVSLWVDRAAAPGGA